MARRDLTGAVDFKYLEDFTAGDGEVIDEVLSLFREQAAIWSALLDPNVEGWRDAVHTIRGAGAGIGAKTLAQVCEEVEFGEQAAAPAGLERVMTALEAALADVAAYRHELALKSLKG